MIIISWTTETAGQLLLPLVFSGKISGQTEKRLDCRVTNQFRCITINRRVHLITQTFSGTKTWATYTEQGGLHFALQTFFSKATSHSFVEKYQYHKGKLFLITLLFFKGGKASQVQQRGKKLFIFVASLKPHNMSSQDLIMKGYYEVWKA